jgi:outer membrane lipoprotein-sorting protein
MHDARPMRRRLAALAALMIAGCGESNAPAPVSAEQEASLVRAVEITGKMLAAYREAGSYTDHATYVEESVLRGEGVAHEIPYYQMSLAFDRPNRLRLTFEEAVAADASGRQGFDIANDGEVVRATLPEIPDQMIEKPAPSRLSEANALPDPLIRQKLLERRLSEVFPQLAMLLNESDADAAAVFFNDHNPRMQADAKLNGRDCYRVATSNPEGTRVLWIDRETYALRRMELPVEAHRQRIDPDHMFLRFAVRIDFEDVTFGAEIDDASFVIEPPKGAHRVRRFVLPEEDFNAQDADGKDAVEVGEGLTTKAQRHQEEENAEEEVQDVGTLIPTNPD